MNAQQLETMKRLGGEIVENGVGRLPIDPPDFIHMHDFENRPKLTRLRVEQIGEGEWCVVATMGDATYGMSLFWRHDDAQKGNVRRTGWTSEIRYWRIFSSRSKAKAAITRTMSKQPVGGLFFLAQGLNNTRVRWDGKNFSPLNSKTRVFRTAGAAALVRKALSLPDAHVYQITETGEVKAYNFKTRDQHGPSTTTGRGNRYVGKIRRIGAAPPAPPPISCSHISVVESAYRPSANPPGDNFASPNAYRMLERYLGDIETTLTGLLDYVAMTRKLVAKMKENGAR